MVTKYPGHPVISRSCNWAHRMSKDRCVRHCRYLHGRNTLIQKKAGLFGNCAEHAIADEAVNLFIHLVGDLPRARLTSMTRINRLGGHMGTLNKPPPVS